MGLWHVWLPPWCCGCQKVWEPVAACDSLWGPIGSPPLKLPPNLRHQCLMPGGLMLRCPDATLAGLAGWLAWLAGLAGWLQCWRVAAGGLLLAGCCWLAAAGWLKVVSHARRSGEVGRFHIAFSIHNWLEVAAMVRYGPWCLV